MPEIRPRALKAAGDLLRHSLLKISRVRLGHVSFEGLAMGGTRDLSKGEINDLRKAAGLTAGVTPGRPPAPTRKKTAHVLRSSSPVRGK